MEIVWKNLKVSEFYKICRLCLANKELEPLAEEEKSTLVKLTPWIAQLETSVYFPNKICTDCAKQLHEANEFLNRCNTLSNSFHKCLEDYKECAKEDRSLPSLEALLFPTKVKIKQEIEQSDNEIEEEASTIIPFTEVFLADDIKKEDLMEFEDTKFIPQQTTSHFVESNNAEFIESTPDIPDAHMMFSRMKKPVIDQTLQPESGSKRKRCGICPRKKDKKTKNSCNLCRIPICDECRVNLCTNCWNEDERIMGLQAGY